MGWGGGDDVLLHLHTCEILHLGDTSHGMGWGGVGMLTFFCTSTHVRFYTWGTHDHMGWGGDDDVLLHLHTCETLHFGHASHGMGWGGDADVLLHLHTCEILHFGHASHGMGWGGGDADVLLHLHTCEILHFGHTSHGMGWVGMLTFFCACTHVRFYTLGTHHMGWGGVGTMTFFCTCAHM